MEIVYNLIEGGPGLASATIGASQTILPAGSNNMAIGSAEPAVVSLVGGSSAPALAFCNSKALNKLLEGPNPDTVIPGALGNLYLAQTLEVPSNRKLTVQAGTYLTRVPGGGSYHLVRNASAQNSLYVKVHHITNSPRMPRFGQGEQAVADPQAVDVQAVLRTRIAHQVI